MWAWTQRPPQEREMNHGPNIQIRRLPAGARLKLGRGEHTVVVNEGVLYVAFEDDELALIPGDEVIIRGRARRRSWNAGSEPVEVAILTRATEAPRVRRRPRAGSI